MSPSEGSPPAEPAVADPPAPEKADSSAGRLVELLEREAPLEPVERLEVLEALSYGVLFEGREFRASRSESVSLLQLDPALGFGPIGLPPGLRVLLAASRVHGPHILSPRALCRSGEDLYCLFDAHPGLSLATGFDFLARAGLRLSSEAVLRIASGALHALDELERQEVGAAENLRCHGLLTPENIHVTENQRVLVRGVGLWQAGIARTGLLGPRQRRYLAPLQSTEGTASPRHDLIALGAILFEATAGCPAFDTPPSEADVSELCVRIEELKQTADASRRDLFALVLACLNPVAVTPASHSRLRVSVDTTFLREAARERVAGILSLEELAARARGARPAIVKAISLTLERVESVTPPAAPKAAAPSAANPLRPTGATAPGAAARPARLPVLPTRPAASTPAGKVADAVRRLFPTRKRTLWALAVGVLLFALFALVLQRACRTPPDESDSSEAAAGPPEPAAVPEPTADSSTAGANGPSAPSGANDAAAGIAAIPPESSAPAAHRLQPGREQDRRKASFAKGPSKSKPPAPVVADSSRAAEALGPAVTAGTLVELGRPGLVPPVLVARPDDPRFSEQDPRPPSPGVVVLELLVDEHGRVQEHRILSASRFPSGIAPGIVAYIGGLRFQAAQLGGVPVRVWIRHEMRFLSP